MFITPMAPKTTRAPKVLPTSPTHSLIYMDRLVALCKQNGVKYFKTSDIELHFNDKTEPLSQPVQVEEKDKSEAREQVLGDLLLENPLAYEEALNRE